MITAELLLIEIEAIISVWMGSYAFVLVSAALKGFLSGNAWEDDEDFEWVLAVFWWKLVDEIDFFLLGGLGNGFKSWRSFNFAFEIS